MSYNPFTWYTKGRPTPRLNTKAPLLLKIRNGDFDYSYMFQEAVDVGALAQQAYDDAYKNYVGRDKTSRKEAALEAGRMKRVTVIKLQMEAAKDEEKILNRLRKELKDEFEIDPWEDALEQLENCSIEQLYWYYKDLSGEVKSKSELDIELRRPNVKGLEYLFKLN